MDTARARRRIAAVDAAVEEALTRWRNHPRSGGHDAPYRGIMYSRRLADRVFYGASALGDHSLIWIMLGAARGLRSERDVAAALRVGAGVAIESVLVNIVVKSLFRRTRPPWDVDRPLPLRRPRTSSFPSGHATSAFTSAVLLAEDDAAWPLYYALAVVVAASRVYVRIHHASDVLAGAAIGLALGLLGRRLAPLAAGPAPAPDAKGSPLD